jgi:hypothetical protein
MFRRSCALLGLVAVMAVPGRASDAIKLPPEITPALRAACEADVRRLCITSESTFQSVRRCVLTNFLRLGRQCQVEITSAGLAP